MWLTLAPGEQVDRGTWIALGVVCLICLAILIPSNLDGDD